MVKGSARIVDLGPSFRMRRLWILWLVTSRLWRHRVTWRHRWRHQSTRRGHFPIGSLLNTSPQIA